MQPNKVSKPAIYLLLFNESYMNTGLLMYVCDCEIPIWQSIFVNVTQWSLLTLTITIKLSVFSKFYLLFISINSYFKSKINRV